MKTLFQEHSISFDSNIPFSKMGYWRIGGQLKYYVPVATSADLSILRSNCKYLTILGNGSNMLMSDKGVDGTAISLVGEFKSSEISDSEVIVGSGVLNTVLLNRLKKCEKSGLGSLAGVPGTIGGAIRMNAGTYLGEIGEQVNWVEWLDESGEVHRSTDLQFKYRKVNLPWTSIITKVSLKINSAGWQEEYLSIRSHLKRRKETQPLNLPSCGSVFKNPTGDYAGRLIDSVSLKGTRIGGAEISAKHANFIVNVEDATAMDVYHLIALARRRVYSETGQILEPEVRPEGDWDVNLWPIELT